jgi:hypothetical protein
MKLTDLKLFKHPAGFQHRELFPNSYGVSVIPESDGITYEVAVLQHTEGKRQHLCYTTGITADVIRYATVDTVDALIERIRSLPAPEDG